MRTRVRSRQLCDLCAAGALLMLFVASAAAQSIDEDASESLSRAGAAEQSAAERADQGVNAAQVAQLIVDQTNALRQAQERSAVSTNGELQEAARYFAEYMARTDRYGHTADGKRPIDRAREHGYKPCLVTENIAYQFSTRPFSSPELARRFVEGWKESPEHRENMLDRDVTETGVAIAQSEETDHYYAVQMFGRPKELSIEVRVENRADVEIEYELADQQFSLPPRYIRTHQQCRPAEVEFLLSQAADDQQRRKSVRVETDTSFVVVRDQAGELQVQQEAAQEDDRQQTVR